MMTDAGDGKQISIISSMGSLLAPSTTILFTLILFGSSRSVASDLHVTLGLLCTAQIGFAQSSAESVDLEAACADVPRHGMHVGQSLTLVEKGVERDRVLEFLSCVAMHPDGRPDAGKLAVRALLYMAVDDSESCRLLLEIVNKETTHLSVVREASRALVYIADETTGRELLEFVKRQWPSLKAAQAAEALKDLGHDNFVTWIDQKKKELPANDVQHGLFDRLRAYASIQKSVPQMLAYIASGETELDRNWLVRQSMRHGATRAQVRDAAILFLQRVIIVPKGYAQAQLVQECKNYDIFRPEDARKYRSIQAFRESNPREPDNRMKWVRIPEVKKAEFYRRPRKEN